MKKTLLLLLLPLTALVLAACGGGGEAASESDSSGPVLVRETVLAEDSFVFDPDAMTVPTGANVTISLENEGTLEHSWVLVDGDLDPLEVTDADAINGASSGNVAGGDSARFSFEAQAPGDYQYVCTIAGHAEGGMVGTFTVTE